MEIQHIVEAIRIAWDPQFKDIRKDIQELKEDNKEQRQWLSEELKALSCKEHGDQMQEIEKTLIELRGEIHTNKRHNDRQDRARDKKETRIWGVFGTVIAGVLLYLATTHLK